MRTTVHVPDDLLQRAKKKAVTEGRTLTSLIEEGLRIVVAGPKSIGSTQTEKASDSMPISSQGGGLLPGVDPVKFLTEDDEWADLEMLKRCGKTK
jgi:hypothetical protein